MKAVFSKLKTKSSTGEDEDGKRSTGSQPIRHLAHGFGSTSRVTGGKVSHQRQTNDSFRIADQRPTVSPDQHKRRPLSTLSLDPHLVPLAGPSSRTPTFRSQPYLESPIGLTLASSDEQLLDAPLRGNRIGNYDAGTAAGPRPQSVYGKPLPPRPSTADADDTFGGSQQRAKTGRSFSYWGLKKSEKPSNSSTIPSANHRSVSTSFLHRRSSEDSTQSRAAESRPSSVAASLSISSQMSSQLDEDKEYCKSRQSWTGITEVDLVANLSVQERTRQEVLFEIVSSEERYVASIHLLGGLC